MTGVCYCYVIQAGHGGPIKIGKAIDPAKRIAGLQTAFPYQIEVRLLLFGGAETERFLHVLLADYRLNGEWFDEKAVARLCEWIRGPQGSCLVSSGTAWSDEKYVPLSPSIAETRARLREGLLTPRVMEVLEPILADPKHPLHGHVVRLTGRWF